MALSLTLPGKQSTRSLNLPGEQIRHDLFVPGTDPIRTITAKPKDVFPHLDRELLYDPPELSQYAKEGRPPCRGVA